MTSLSLLAGRTVAAYIFSLNFFQSSVSQGFVFMMVGTIALKAMKMMNTTFLLELYSKTCLKQPLKKNTKYWFSRPIIAKCSSKVLQNAPREHSAILLTFFKLLFVLKTFVLSIFEGPLKTGFTVHNLDVFFFQSSVSQEFVFMMVVIIALNVMKMMNTTFLLELYITGTFGNIKVIFTSIFHSFPFLYF